MKTNYVLAIEAGYSASFAIANQGRIIEEFVFDDKRQLSECLAHEISQSFQKYQLSIHDFSDYIINIGPGSYTGLRVALSFLNGCCQASSAKLTAINSFELLSFQLEALENPLFILESKKDEVYYKTSLEPISVLKKSQLRTMEFNHYVSNSLSDLTAYLPAEKIQINEFTARQIIQLFYRQSFLPNQAADILYVKNYGD